MGRSPCCSKEGLNRGAWTADEDRILTNFVKAHGEGRWRNLPQLAGLKRCGKSCRLRWLNYLRPDIKRGNISQDEEELIIRLHKLLGNRWSLIAGRLPGRTDNEIKNYWNTNLGKRVQNHHTTTTSSATTTASAPKQDTPVVRTKATRCTKVFLSPSPPPRNQPLQANDTSPSSKLVKEKDDHSMDFALDLDLNFGDFCFSEFLDSDFTSYRSDRIDGFDLSPSVFGL